MTIHIPDWLFDSHFWAGFGACFVLFVALFLYWARSLQ